MAPGTEKSDRSSANASVNCATPATVTNIAASSANAVARFREPVPAIAITTAGIVGMTAVTDTGATATIGTIAMTGTIGTDAVTDD